MTEKDASLAKLAALPKKLQFPEWGVSIFVQ